MKILLKDEEPVYQSTRRLSPSERAEVNAQIDELAKDEQKIRELEMKHNLTASKLKEMQSESEDEKHNVKSKTDCSDKMKNLLDVSARISHLDHVLKEKSMDLERTADMDEKEALRHEIRNLRRTRDCLVDEKCDLDEKFQKERTLTTVEERKLLECGEIIEAIDAMIEHKNEMICRRKDFDENQSQREKGERMLTSMERLKKCCFLQTRVEFLGHVIEGGHVRPSDRKTETVRRFPEPINVKQVQSFLGLSGYFGKFIPGYAAIAHPFRVLLGTRPRLKECPEIREMLERELFKSFQDTRDEL